MVKKLKILFAVTALCVLAVLPLSAKDIKFEISAGGGRVVLGRPLELDLTFNNTQDMPAPELPALNDFQARYLGPSTRMSIVNGKVSSSITHMYSILPSKAGTFTIGPFTFEHNGDKYTSNALTLDVASAGRQEPQDSAGAQEPVAAQNLNDKIFLVMKPGKSKDYVNETIPLTVQLFVNSLGVRDIQFPQFDHEGVSIGTFEQPKQYQEEVNGIAYDVIEFKTAIFGLQPGQFSLGPADLHCNLIVKKQSTRRNDPFSDDFFGSDVFDNFFGRFEAYPYEVKSGNAPFTVLPVPQEGKPADFSGAMGDFTFISTASPREVKAGDPVTLKITVRGQGNLATVDLSHINWGSDFKAYDAQVSIKDGEKNFEQVLIPLSARVKEIPQVNFTFFNTTSGKYESAVLGPFPLTVSGPEHEEAIKMVGAKITTAPLVKEESLGRDIVYIKDLPGHLQRSGEYLYRNKIFLLFQAVFVLFYFLALAVYNRKKHLHSDLKYARRLLAPRKARQGMLKAQNYLKQNSTKEFFDTLFITLQEYLGGMFHLPSQSITESVVDEQLKNKNIPPEALIKLKNIFKTCDAARYAGTSCGQEEMERAFKDLQEIIDYFQRHKL